jgi:hypothetical protein
MNTNQVVCPRCEKNTVRLTALQMRAAATGNLMAGDTICSDCNDELGRALNGAQRILLQLIARGGPAVVVYGRAYAATALALGKRGLIKTVGAVMVASMGHTETRPLWQLTAAGEDWISAHPVGTPARGIGARPYYRSSGPGVRS